MTPRSWSEPLSEGAERRLARIADLGERSVSVVLFSALALRVGAQAAAKPWNLAILLPEGLVVLFMLLRRRPQAVSTRPWDWFVALAGTAGPMLVTPGGHPIATPAVSVGVILTGLVLSVWGKLTLRRSFGLAAANRGVVDTGAYGFVRHPIYAGYVISYVGFLLANLSARNLVIYAVAIALQVIRINAEEAVLGSDPRYAAFMSRVRWRLAPGLY